MCLYIFLNDCILISTTKGRVGSVVHPAFESTVRP